MMPSTSGATVPAEAVHAADTEVSSRSRVLYRIVWRWHFLAGLACLPVLVMLAVTGGLYLFRDDINDALFASRRLLPAESVTAPRLPLDELAARALRDRPGELREVRMPASADRSVAFVVQAAPGVRGVVFADPTNARVLGVVEDESRVWDTVVKHLHSMVLVGRWANIGVELAAGWCVVLVVTGVYLWWPRRERGGVLTVRGTPARRVWWRDVHAVTGALTGLVITFLAVTGMPWSSLWGEQFNRLSTALGLGHPPYVWGGAPPSTRPQGQDGQVAWTFEQVPAPSSVAVEHAGHVAGGAASPPSASAIGVARAAAVFAALGLRAGYSLRLPDGPEGVYSAYRFPADVRQQRVVHLDQYTGKVLADIRFDDYGPVAQAVEWGVGVHTGQQYGRWNQFVMLAGCVGIVVLAVCGVVMWWKRRPRGSFGTPARKAEDRLAHGALLIAFALGLFYPPLGASMLVAALLERLWGRRRRPA